MSFEFKNCSEEELWRYVGKQLSRNGFDAILVGGAVVSIYSKGAYRSGDLDFIIQNLTKDKLPEVMGEIGFVKEGRSYIHPKCSHLFVEFPPGPIGIGNDSNIRPRVEKSNKIEIKILSPTDCIKDRLASFIHFNSYEGMEQAVLVARSQPFNCLAVKKWCKNENRHDVFEEFTQLLKPTI